MENIVVLLESRPKSDDVAQCFRLESRAVPELAPGEVLLQTLWLSVEPFMMLAIQGPLGPKPKFMAEMPRLKSLQSLYASGVELGEVMGGPAVCRVVQSRNRQFGEGDVVETYSAWQRFVIDDGSLLRKITPSAVPLSAYLGVLGIPGLTGYSGMVRIGLPKAGEAVVLSAAMGPVATVAADVARQAGARTIGIASGQAKCKQLVENLGYDAAVDRLDIAFADRLKEACPRGVDVYFENVGGMIWQTMLPMLRYHARVPVSGLVADYGPTEGGRTDSVAALMKKVLFHRLRVEGLAVFDHGDLEEQFLANISARISEGKLSYLEHVYHGIEALPHVLSEVLRGRNIGKAVTKISE